MVDSDGGVENDEIVEDIDDRRLNRKAYDYLCRLLEVRKWLSECLNDDSIPSVTELENNFRNGVLLARLSNFFAPEVVPLKGIYDLEQEKYHSNDGVPLYKHTDNIMQWRRAMESVRLPEIFIPETTDVFEGRNMKTTFCLYALATLLYRLRKAPPLRNQAGKAEFTKGEMDEMKEHLKDSKLPEFGEVGEMLSDRMTNDERAQATAIMHINKAIDNQDKCELLLSLQHSDAGILYVEEMLDIQYLNNLSLQKNSIENNILSKRHIQDTVIDTNNLFALSELDKIISNDGTETISLLHILDILFDNGGREHALELYLSMLKKGKFSNMGHPLNKDQVKKIIAVANAIAEVKLVVLHGSSDHTLKALKNPILELDVRTENAKLYYNRLFYNYQKSASDFFLSKNDLQNILYEVDNLSTDQRKLLELNSAVEKGDKITAANLIRELSGDLFIEENTEFYLQKLAKTTINNLKELTTEVQQTNSLVGRAFQEADAMVRLNKSLISVDYSTTRLNLLAVISLNNCTIFRRELLHWYVNKLILEAQQRAKHVQRENHVCNGHSHVEDGHTVETRKLCDHTWFDHDFLLGKVWIDVIDHKRSTSRNVPETESYLHWKDVEDTLKTENENFERHYITNESSVRKSQEIFRRYLQNKRTKEQYMGQQRMEEATRTIQTSYRKYRSRREHRELWNCESPQLDFLRKFIEHLEDIQIDLTEELEIEELKTRVNQLIVSNRQLDAELCKLDENIELLIKNRLNLQEVIAHKDKIADKFANRPTTMRKKERDNIKQLEQLFFHLQTDSQYFANLIQGKRVNLDEFDVMSKCIAPTFGYVTEKREQFLMVRLLCDLLSRDIKKIKRIEEIMITPSIKVVKDVMNNIFETVNENPCFAISNSLNSFLSEGCNSAVFNLNPDDIFLSVYGKKPVDIHEALQDAVVVKILENSKTFLAKWSEMIVHELVSKYKLPASVLYLTCFLEDILRRQLPSTSLFDIQKIVNGFVFEVFFHQNVVSPRGLFRVTHKEIGEDDHQRLECIVQFIGFAVANKGYGNSKWYLTSLNKQIQIINEEFRLFISQQTANCRLEDIYGLNEITQFDPSHKPQLNLMEKDLSCILKYLKENIAILAPDSSDCVHMLVLSIYFPEEVEVEKTIVLHLHPMIEMTEAGDGQELFVRAKKYVIDLLISGCKGSNIAELLSMKAGNNEEELYRKKSNSENMANIAEKQLEIRRCLYELKNYGRVSAEDNYRAVVTDIVNDIRLMICRRKERMEQRRNLEATQNKLQTQRMELNERMVRYEEYIDTCLENLNRTSRRLSFRPNTKEAGKIQKKRQSLDIIQSFKSSADKLFRKGVLIDLLNPEYQNAKRLAKLSVDIASTEKKGIFKITLFEGKEIINNFTLNFQDLLKSDSYENERFVLSDILVLDVPRTIQYINRKFYNK